MADLAKASSSCQQGGELWAHDDEGDVPVDLTESIRQSLSTVAGKGREHELHEPC